MVKIIKTYDNFEEKWIEQDSVIRNLEIIGEASNHISDDLKQKYPDVAWNQMKGMRNFMTHEYFGLQLDTIWDAAVNDIPASFAKASWWTEVTDIIATAIRTRLIDLVEFLKFI